jgi:hypothetical protein
MGVAQDEPTDVQPALVASSSSGAPLTDILAGPTESTEKTDSGYKQRSGSRSPEPATRPGSPALQRHKPATSRVVGARAIAPALSVAPSTIYSWTKHHRSPIPIYSTPDGRLWASREDIEAYWGRSEKACDARDEVERAAFEAAKRVIEQERLSPRHTQKKKES